MPTTWITKNSQSINRNIIEQAQQHQNSLTKPAGSLGLLESVAIQFAGWQSNLSPRCESILVRVFAADHGVCAQNVSAFPQQVTAQMIDNFLSGGAAISVLSKKLDADFSVINMGTVKPIADADKLINAQLTNGTNDFTQTKAMSEAVMQAALQIGREQLIDSKSQLFIGGDMGIGNSTTASAIYSALLNVEPEITVGPGTGVDLQGIQRKQTAIKQALSLHADKLGSPLNILQCVGGLEIAALVGAYITAAQQGIPILVDGFITTAAALLAVKINPSIKSWMLFAHQSAEPAHKLALDHLNATPLLNIGMRLGEGSGAAVAVPLIQSALTLHNNMATFADAGVSES